MYTKQVTTNYIYSTFHVYKLPEIRKVRELFLQGFSPLEIGRETMINPVSIERLISRLIKQKKIQLDVTLNEITTGFLNNLLTNKLPQYHVTKIFGEGWCIFTKDNKLVKKLGSYKYSVYKQVEKFINENI